MCLSQRIAAIAACALGIYLAFLHVQAAHGARADLYKPVLWFTWRPPTAVAEKDFRAFAASLDEDSKRVVLVDHAFTTETRL